MTISKETETKTLTAGTFDTETASGIAIGTHQDGTVATIEGGPGEVVILLNDYLLSKANIKVVHTDADWNVI